ncbi:unnamed protein product, partial [Aphanomyces euteiches]
MKKDAAEHKLTPKATYSPKTDVRIVKRTGLVNELIAHTRNSSLPLVPDVIRDAGLAFFVDEARTQTSVELRGERNMERIYFKAKDVGSVFESDNFLDTKKTWVQQLCRVDKSFMEAFMKLVPNGIAYIYLVDTNQCEDDKRVFKFGRTTNVKDRFYSHASSFGDDCRLDTLVLVPLNILSAAKTQFKRMIADMFRCPSGNTQELLVLDTDGYNVIRECMQTVADTYNGNLALHSHILDSKVKQVQNQMHELCLKANCGSRECSNNNWKQPNCNWSSKSRLRLETQELKFNAQLLEKDRRIAELIGLEEED